MKSTKFWVILIVVVLAVSAVASAALFLGKLGDAVALVYQDGACIRTIDLDRVDGPYSFTVEWKGGYNVIEVERGRIRVAEADCPDQVCVLRGWVSDGVIPIACLPHRLVIRLEGGADSIVDGAVG